MILCYDKNVAFHQGECDDFVKEVKMLQVN